LHMRIVRSNFAHGRLRAIDADSALALPGVQAVWTAADVADIPPIDFRLSRIEGLEPYRQRLFADDFVRYVGEPVAAVFADDPYLAEDAAELVALDIEELPAILQADEPPGEFCKPAQPRSALAGAPPFFATIQRSIFSSRIFIGSAPESSTWAWNSRISNFGPSSVSAFFLSRWMVSAPIL